MDWASRWRLSATITGAAYLFRVEIEEWLYPDLLSVPARSAPQMSGDQIVASAQQRFPGSEAASYVPALVPGETAHVILGGDHSHDAATAGLEVFVNPYDAHVLGSQDPEQRLMKRIRNLHGRLMVGRTGQAFMELVAGWMVLLLLSGLYLWFPRGHWSVWGVFLPRIRSGKRILLRDLHAVPAVYLTAVLTFQLISGMPWTYFEGKLIRQVADNSPGGVPITDAKRFRSQAPEQPVAAPAGSAQDWLGDLSATNSTHVHSALSTGRLPLDQVVAIATKQGVARPFQITLPRGDAGVFTVRSLSDDPRDTIYLHLDQYSGAVAGRIPFAQLTPMAQSIALGIALHEGRLYGRANQLLGLAGALGAFYLATAATVLWWSRRPKGHLGAQPGTEKFVMPRGAVVLIVVLGILFPLMGASLVLIYCLDRFIAPRTFVKATEQS
jgi:uncharacterized iron-regulated membrane protein